MHPYVKLLRVAAVAATAAISVGSAPLGRAQDVDAVLDKAEQALGGHGLLADIETVRIRSHGMWEMPARSIPPTPYQVELVFRRPDQYRLIWTFPEEMGGKFTFGHDGQDAWGILGGPPARCKGWHREDVLQVATELQAYLIVPAREASGDTFALDPDAKGDDPNWIKATWHPFAKDKPWNVWFDRNTGELVMLEHESYQMDGQPALARLKRSAPKDFNGLRYPTRTKLEAVRAGKVIEAAEETIDSVEVNPAVPTEFFAYPEREFDAATLSTKDQPGETVVKFLHRGPYNDIGKSLAPAMDVIMAAGLVPMGAASGTYFNDPTTVAPSDIQTELAVRVVNLKEGSPQLPSGYEFTTRPAARVAYAYHRGDHRTEGEAHQRLRTWMAEQGLFPVGPPRAIWFHDPDLTVTEDLITEIQIPIGQSAVNSSQ